MTREPIWIIQETDPDKLRSVENTEVSSRLDPLVQKLLCLRGHCTEDEIKQFLFPRLKDLADPFLLPEMDRAVERIFKAIDAGERIVLYGDYDVDGVTSLALLKEILKAYGQTAATFLPSRTGEGYGVSRDGLARCIEEHDPQLVIAIDCGTSSADELAWLAEQGIDAIVFDHHECPPGARPKIVALVNPKSPAEGEGPNSYSYLCSAGLAFKVAHALLKTRPVDGFDLRDFMDIAALGTVADIVPLIAENRLLVRRGLLQLAKTRSPGLRALMKVASVRGPILSTDVGFRLGPRLNASGRMDSAQASLDLLLTESETDAKSLAEQLDGHNRDRQELERSVVDRADIVLKDTFDPDEDVCIVIGDHGWHPGVVGIVASRLMRTYHRPAFVIAFDENGLGKGSGRSVEGVSLIEAINASSDHLINGGGHDMAAGITLRRESLDAFRQAFSENIRQAVNGTDRLVPRLKIDAEADFTELTLEALDSYELLHPFGASNPEPLLIAKNVELAGEPRILGGKHLKLRLYQNGITREAMFFGAAPKYPEMPPPPWDIAFHVQRNVFRGNESVQLSLRALRAAKG